ncbi:hypothetical protein [Bradyrhizobium sp. MOS002]|uniref:hypothetical protein n=1 Tax=Bradyrhizobium sp. MOS002 TaxID=2133947 RepID=UPI000D138F69|nr:hypothetical protein [Bradyrhizobium sp. MOS002]PSO32527.1 hypothetical protein C7G41_12840 [Bradyrhizobium sp. MOS002]
MTAATVLPGLLVALLIVTVMPGSSALDMNIDVGIKVFAFYLAFVAWAVLSVLLVNVMFAPWTLDGGSAVRK